MGRLGKTSKAFKHDGSITGVSSSRSGGAKQGYVAAPAEIQEEAQSMFGFTTSDRVVLVEAKKEGIVVGFHDYGTVEVKLSNDGGTVEFDPEELSKIVIFEVQLKRPELGTRKETVEMYGNTLGDFREVLESVFGIRPFEQGVVFTPRDGEPQELTGDDSVLLSESGLIGAEQVCLSMKVDPRFKMEKETAFLEALVACRFDEAMAELYSTSGMVIDPNCVYNFRASEGKYCASEAPKEYAYPAISVAMLAGFPCGGFHFEGEKYLADLRTWLAHEKQVKEVVEYLIRMAADVNATGDETQSAGSAGAPETHGKTPLCWAVQRGSVPLVRTLLEARANPALTCSSSGSVSTPSGPGSIKARDFTLEISNGSVQERNTKDPRGKHSSEIIALLNKHDESDE